MQKGKFYEEAGILVGSVQFISNCYGTFPSSDDLRALASDLRLVAKRMDDLINVAEMEGTFNE